MDSAHSKSDLEWPKMFENFRDYCLEYKNESNTHVQTVVEHLVWTNSDGEVICLGRWMHTQNKLRREGRLRAVRLETFQNELISTGLFKWPERKVPFCEKFPEMVMKTDKKPRDEKIEH